MLNVFEPSDPFHIYLLVAFAGFVLASYPSGWRRRRARLREAASAALGAKRRAEAKAAAADRAVVQRFGEVFAAAPEDKREQIINTWRKQKSCSRIDAMRYAIRARERRVAAAREQV